MMCQMLWFIRVGFLSWAAWEAFIVNKSLLVHFVSHLIFLNLSEVLHGVFLGGPLEMLRVVCSSIPAALTVIFAVTSVHLAWSCVSCRYPPGCHRGHCIHSKGTSNALTGECLESCYFNEAKGFHLALGIFLRTHTHVLPFFLLNDRWYFSSQSSGCFKMPQMICLCCDDS